MRHTVLSVPEISCNHCKMTIEGAVKGLRGIGSVEADVAGRRVSLDFDESKVTLDEIRGAIEEAGYAVES
ncbi:MAG: heavy-metal-associated domain-containing protein [Spirochaetes bacterium]|nr:heavy-metal-associated domain-containing protein [Spirochaetota bacterium]